MDYISIYRTEAMTVQAIISRLDKIERDQKRILDLLAGNKKKKQWVKASDILRLTGWNREKLRQRRADGLVEFKRDGKGWFYNPDSIPSVLINPKNENA